MNYQNQVHFTAQPAAGFKVRQNLRRRKVLDLPGGITLWLAVSKVSCLILLLMLGANLWIGSAVKDMHASIQSIEANQYAIRDRQIHLLAERAQLMSEKYVREQAREELALIVPGSRQVFKIR